MISSAERIERGNWPGSAHEARRFILDRLPGSSPVEGLSAEADRYGRVEEPATVVEPSVIEGEFRSIRVVESDSQRGVTGFSGFLDGTERIQVIGYYHNEIPILWATVATAVRIRVDRRLVSWPAGNPIVRQGFYVPLRYMPDLSEEIRNDPRTVDTGAADKILTRHPAALREAAVKRIQKNRESAEQELTEAWCASETGVLFVDGSLTGSRISSKSDRAVGIVKSHNRLYLPADAYGVLTGLRAGERTAIFLVNPDTPSRFSVASWYLRIRQSTGHDMFFGLVRVEAALTDDISSRADEISRWILAERLPVALPDPRWDKMAYGIRNTEEFLRAIS